jgi:plastocyanin
VNKDVIPHTATARGGAFDSAAVAAGASWRFTVRTKGRTDYDCAFHPTMTGRLDAE